MPRSCLHRPLPGRVTESALLALVWAFWPGGPLALARQQCDRAGWDHHSGRPWSPPCRSRPGPAWRAPGHCQPAPPVCQRARTGRAASVPRRWSLKPRPRLLRRPARPGPSRRPQPPLALQERGDGAHGTQDRASPGPGLQPGVPGVVAAPFKFSLKIEFGSGQAYYTAEV